MRWLAALVLVPLALVACGDSSPEEGSAQRLSPAERSQVTHARAAIRSYCRELGLFLAGRSEPPRPEVVQGARGAVQELGAVARQKPDAPYGTAGTMRDLLGDLTEDLEGTNCSRALVDELDAALRSLPQPEEPATRP